MTYTETTRHIRLSPTVLFRVPDCYLAQKPDTVRERCWLCPVRKQCENKTPIENPALLPIT